MSSKAGGTVGYKVYSDEKCGAHREFSLALRAGVRRSWPARAPGVASAANRSRAEERPRRRS